MEAKKMKRPSLLLAACLCHLAACLVFVVANDIGLSLYQNFLAETGSRGIAPGAVTRLVFLQFVISSALIALVPVHRLKLAVIVVAMAMLAWSLLPQHPMRAIFYCTLNGVLSVAAVMATRRFVQWLNTRWPAS
jgi:hypothetical protein